VFRFSLQILSETFLILRSILRETVINVHRSSCKVLVILVRVESNLNFLVIFSENYLMPNVMKSVQWGRVVIPCGQTDRQRRRTAFRIFVNAPKNCGRSSRGVFENVVQLLFWRD